MNCLLSNQNSIIWFNYRSQFQLKKLYDEETRGETSGGSFVDKLLSNAKKQNELLKILNKHDRFLIIDMIKKITSLQL